MAFLAPIMLVGLIGVAAPIIIHLLERSRNVPQEFPTLRLLMAAQQQSSRRTKLRNLIVLFLRCLLIALLVLAMAQPYTQDETWARPPELPTTLVIVLDHSYSMGYRDGSDATTRFDRAKQMAMEQVAALSARDEVALVLAGDRATVVTARPTRDHQRIIELIQRAELSYAPGDMRDALSTAFALSQLDALSEDEEQEAREAQQTDAGVDPDTGIATTGPRARRQAWRQIMVISDTQRSAWREAIEDGLIAELDAAIPDRSVPVTLADLSTANASNRFIRRVDVSEDPTGGMLSVTIDVVTHGPSRPRGGQATLFLNGQRSGSPELLPGTDGTVTLRADLPRPGVHIGSVRMEEDRLAIDDTAHFAINVTGGRDLIVVDGRPSRTPGRAAAYFLNAALEIRQQRSAQPLNVTQRTPSELSTQRLPDGGALMLINVERLDGSALANIEDFLRSGGNVFIALGDQVDVEHYNADWSFMPMPLTGRLGDPGRSLATALIIQAPEHPIFAEGIDLAATRYFAFIGSDTAELRHDAQVLATFVDESPALVEGRFAGEGTGGGRVLVLTGPVDATWSNFPYRRAFVPFVDQVVSHLTRQRIAARSVTLGRPVRFEGPPSFEGEPLTITTPSDERETLRAELDSRGRRVVAEFRGTHEPGVYRVEADPAFGAGGAFAVNLDTRGSILTPIERDAVRAAFGDRPVRFVRDEVAANLNLGGWHAEDEQTLGEQRREWWPWLLLAALCVFVVESLLANFFTRRPTATVAGTQYMETRRTDALAGRSIEAPTLLDDLVGTHADE